MSLRMSLSNIIENNTKPKDNISDVQKFMEHNLNETENVLNKNINCIQEYYNKLNSYDINCNGKMDDILALMEKYSNDLKTYSDLTMDMNATLCNLGKTVEITGDIVELSGKKAEEKTEEIGEKVINNVTELVSNQLQQINFQMNVQLSSIANEFIMIKKVIRRQMLISFLLFFIIAAGLSVLSIMVLYYMDYIPF